MVTPAVVRNMSIEEKLQAMEFLWEELCRVPEAVPSPDWHRAVLAERERAVMSGEEQFEDWEEAKRKIREEISCGPDICGVRLQAGAGTNSRKA